MTSDVAFRLAWHNDGRSCHTANHRPWRVLAIIEFDNPDSAASFERYLKTGSGRAFAKRHLK
jgi:predicted GIY-YIG superfamily endonuclease